MEKYQLRWREGGTDDEEDNDKPGVQGGSSNDRLSINVGFTS